MRIRKCHTRTKTEREIYKIRTNDLGNFVSADDKDGSLANNPTSVFSFGNLHNSRNSCVVPSAALANSNDSFTEMELAAGAVMVGGLL